MNFESYLTKILDGWLMRNKRSSSGRQEKLRADAKDAKKGRVKRTEQRSMVGIWSDWRKGSAVRIYDELQVLRQKGGRENRGRRRGGSKNVRWRGSTVSKRGCRGLWYVDARCK